MDPNRYPEPSDMLLGDLYELYFPPRDEEWYDELAEWTQLYDPK